jgi:DNA-binding MarR family transcriptional regulator
MPDSGGRKRIGRESQPETAALRLLQTAMGDTEVALSRRLGMSHTDLTAMAHLTFTPQAMGPRQLSGRLGITPGAATELVDRLERAGHLERRRDTVDRRRVHLIPTASALDQVGQELRPLIAALDSVVAEYSEEERAAIRRYLADVLDAYQRFTASAPEPNSARSQQVVDHD